MLEQDRELLCLIEQDCRIPPEKLAVLTGLSVDYILEKIQQWEDDKVIVQYRPLINWEKAGQESVSALIEVRVQPQRGAGFDKIAKRIQKFPEVRTVYLMSGGFDLTLIIEGKSMQEVALFVAEKLAPLDHVQSTATHFVLRRYKQNGVEFITEDETPQRQAVWP
ncbi:MAG: Lrp/AsnC family transcriptional regulator [Peptococcaceae bacterium]|nr:Lrp/AsnC family transcriptional regulator [Peptococcaceae bacterium]